MEQHFILQLVLPALRHLSPFAKWIDHFFSFSEIIYSTGTPHDSDL